MENEIKYLHLPVKSVINGHDRHGSDTKARHNSSHKISEPLGSLLGQSLGPTYGRDYNWDLGIGFRLVDVGTWLLVLHDNVDGET